MNDKPHIKSESTRSWLERLGDFLLREPQDREQLVELLRDAEQRQLLDANALGMIEGVLQVSTMQARDIMIPRSQMVIVHHDMEIPELLSTVIDSGHSRFPMITKDGDEVLGILLAKDLLRIVGEQYLKKRTQLKEILRSAIIIPESKRLDVLLQEFRVNRNHMAIVVDEYGGVAGLVTIEDVLEQIVGEIADEYDVDEEIYIKKQSDTEYTVKALTPIKEFNDYFKTDLSDEEVDTIGGLVMQNLGHLPKPGEKTIIDAYEFKVIHADNRRIRLLQVKFLEKVEEE